MRTFALLLWVLVGCGGTPTPTPSGAVSETSGDPPPPVAAEAAKATEERTDEPTPPAVKERPAQPLAEPHAEPVCTEQNHVACVWLAVCHSLGVRGYTKDARLAATYNDIACRAGDLEGCASLAEQYEWGRGVPRDGAKSRALLQKACDGDVQCAMLAYFLLESQDNDDSNNVADRREALRLFEQSCNKGDRFSCFMRADRAPTRRDGRPWFRKACDLGHPRACGKL